MQRSQEPNVVCLGFFDGVHLGHLRLLSEANRVKQKYGYRVCVHTYQTSPVAILQPKTPIHELTGLKEKYDLLMAAGADSVAVSPFDERMMHMSGRAFFEEILLEKLFAKHLVVGFDHRFGYKGEVTTDKLFKLCEEKNVGLSVVMPVRTKDGEIVSSSAIRQALQTNDLQKAAEMLGRPICS